MAEHRRHVVKNLVLIIISVLVTLVVAEMLLRVSGFSYSPMNVRVLGNRYDWRYKHAFQDDHFVFDPYLIWAPKPGATPFNEQGLRGEVLSPSKENEFRIFAIGDSNTLGWSAEGGANWPKYLGNLLDKIDSNYSVTNAGVYGYTSFQGLRQFRQVLHFKPDMVLMSFGSNDAHLVVVSDADYVDNTITRMDAIFCHFRVFHLILTVRDRFTRSGQAPPTEELVHRVSVDQYERNLAQIILTAKRHGIICCLLTRPFVGESPNHLWWKNFGPAYVKATLKVAKQYQIPVVDVYGHFKDKKQYFADESHFTEQGHRIAAKLVFEAIQPLLPTKRQSKTAKTEGG